MEDNKKRTQSQSTEEERRRSCAVLGPIADDHDAFAHLPDHGLSMFLAERTKTVHFVRHAEGHHNEAVREHGDETPTIFSTPGSERFLDARLNEAGRRQCEEVREALGPRVNPELVVVSPLTRTLETAHIIFSGRGSSDEQDEGPSCQGKPPPFLVHDVCRERWGKYMNDKRRPASEIQAEFGPRFDKTGDTIDFDTFGFASEEDDQWTEEREPDESCHERGIELLKWIIDRPEKELAVVTHSSFLRHLFTQFGDNLAKGDRTALQRSAGNAEVRSITLAAHRGCGRPVNSVVTPDE